MNKRAMKWIDCSSPLDGIAGIWCINDIVWSRWNLREISYMPLQYMDLILLYNIWHCKIQNTSLIYLLILKKGKCKNIKFLFVSQMPSVWLVDASMTQWFSLTWNTGPLKSSTRAPNPKWRWSTKERWRPSTQRRCLLWSSPRWRRFLRPIWARWEESNQIQKNTILKYLNYLSNSFNIACR